MTLRFLADPQKAEDATHDVFLKAFTRMDQFRGEASIRTWLYRIAINHCQNLCQSWHNRHVHTTADDALWEGTAARNRFAFAGAGNQGIGPAHSAGAGCVAR